MKQITIKMNEKEAQLYKEAKARAAIESAALPEDKRVGTWIGEAIKAKLDKA